MADEARDKVRAVLSQIEQLLADLREQIIDGDPEMHQALEDLPTHEQESE